MARRHTKPDIKNNRRQFPVPKGQGKLFGESSLKASKNSKPLAKVYVYKQYDSLMSVFLRLLEYYRGMMVLTINRIKDIDDAIHSRISVALHYGPLGLATRKMIWESFLKKVATTKGRAEYTATDLDWLSEKEVNGRQIKNMITIAHALAVEEMVPLTRSHLEW